MTKLDLAVIKVGEAELLLNRCLASEPAHNDLVNGLLIKLTKIRIELEALGPVEPFPNAQEIAGLSQDAA